MGGRYVLEVINSKYLQKPAGLYHLLCDAYLDCGIDVLIFGIGLFIRCSCYGRKYVDADDWNFAYVSIDIFSAIARTSMMQTPCRQTVHRRRYILYSITGSLSHKKTEKT